MGMLDTGVDHLVGRIEGHVAVLSFNRPEARNALSEEIYQGFSNTLPRIAEDPAIRVVMITGENGAFCSGGDVKNMNRNNQGQGDVPRTASIESTVTGLRRRQNQVSLALRTLPKPVVAAIPGPAAGAGLSIAFAADLRIASESSFLFTAFSNIGASGDFGTSWFLPRIVGEAKAKELMFLSPRLTAQEAKELNIVNAILPDEDFPTAAVEWCRVLGERAPIALRYMKENVNRSLDVGLQQALDAEAVAMVRTMSTADHKEAALAFVEKRPPRFTGN